MPRASRIKHSAGKKHTGQPPAVVPGPNATLRLLRQRIIDGALGIGERLPSRRVLAKSLDVSPVTLQRALDRLEKEGFVRLVDRVGSFVAERPPHIARFPLVFTGSPTTPGSHWNRFWDLLHKNAPDVAAASNTQMPAYLDIQGHADNEDYQSLLGDVDAGRLAGLIFTTSPWIIANTPLVTTPGIPRVAITRDAQGMHVVTPDFSSFFERAVEYLASRGRQRVALLVPERLLAIWRVDIERLLHRHGMWTRAEWIQSIAAPDSARSVMHLLMSPRYQDRPDGLILAQDNWIDHATAGLIAAGVRVPEDADLVTHFNFPYPAPDVMPFKRLGWDVRHLLQACVDVLNEHRATKQKNHRVIERRMPAMFDHELAGG